MAKKRTTSKSRKKTSAKKNKALPAVILGGSVGLFVAFVVFLAILIGVLFNYHFLMTDDGFEVVKKIHWGAKDTFANTKDWGPIDWLEHDEVGRALVNREIDRAQKKWFE